MDIKKIEPANAGQASIPTASQGAVTASPVVVPEGETNKSLNPSASIIGATLVENDKEKYGALKTYQTVLRATAHDVRAPLTSIFNQISLLRQKGDFSSNEVLLRLLQRFEITYEKFVKGKEHNYLTEEDNLGKLEYWKQLSLKEGRPEDTLRSLMDYRANLEKGFRTEFFPLVKELAQEIAKLNPRPVDSDRISRTADFALTFFDNFDARLADNPGDIRTFTPREAVQEAINFTESNLTLTVSPKGPNNPIIMDPNRFKNIILNLIINAAKYGDRCLITFEEADGFVRVRVSDNGPGVKDDDKERIFEEGVSGSPGESKGPSSGKNEGLGLATIRRDLKIVNGSIKVEDAPGSVREQLNIPNSNKGASFVIEIPLASLQKGTPLAEKANPTTIAQEKRPSTTLPLRVLIIDDDEDIRDLLPLLIELAYKGKCIFQTATTVQEALDMLDTTTSDKLPHLILVDVGLPGGILGPEIKPRLDERNIRGITVIAQTNNNPKETLRDFSYLDGAVQKPVDMTDPEDRCRRIIGKIIAGLSS